LIFDRLTEELVKQIKLTVRKELSARHVPSIILEIADIPVSNIATYLCMYASSNVINWTEMLLLVATGGIAM